MLHNLLVYVCLVTLQLVAGTTVFHIGTSNVPYNYLIETHTNISLALQISQ